MLIFLIAIDTAGISTLLIRIPQHWCFLVVSIASVGLIESLKKISDRPLGSRFHFLLPSLQRIIGCCCRCLTRSFILCQLQEQLVVGSLSFISCDVTLAFFLRCHA